MATATLITGDLLDPIPGGAPAGQDLRWTPEWDRIKEARRSDDNLKLDKWAKKDHKSANWTQVLELTTAALADRSKDLQLAVWFLEAGLKTYAWTGLRDGLRLMRELMERYWERGLFPAIEDGPEDRSGPIEWLNERLVELVGEIPITARAGDTNYNLNQLAEARRVGSEASTKTPDGDVDPAKKKQFDADMAQGKISLDKFERAVKDSKRADAEALAIVVDECEAEFTALARIVEEKFGGIAPGLSAMRERLREVKREVETIVEKKRKDEPDPTELGKPEAPGDTSQGTSPRMILRMPLHPVMSSGAVGGSWQEAEQLIRAGQVDQGLAEMTRLASAETTGRDRFHRKLLLAEVCLASGRERLAQSILEQLAQHIDDYKLENWESSDLIGSVWGRLYELYRSRDGQSDKTKTLYERLCRLDPWQALQCEEK
jgi:type VI secretion system protein ImpA